MASPYRPPRRYQQPHRRPFSWAARAIAAGASVVLASGGMARAQTAKTFIDYIKPTPITCALSSATWGASAVLPRDICNGIESANGAGAAPSYYYWDGKIIRAADGTYHLFASSWPGSTGFNPGWVSSDAIHATSSSPLGQYQRLGYAYDNGPDSGNRHHGHNVSAAELLDGTYALIVSEVVPFTVFTSPSLNGPWVPCPNPSGELIQKNGVNAGTDGHLDSNVSFVPRPDGKFEIVQRHGLIAVANTICGPYQLQTPTNTYPSNQQPSFASIFPNRSKHASIDTYAPSTVESTSLAEDPVIWYSGGQFHVLYDYPDDRVGYHLTSIDGIHNWTDRGFAYDPRMASALFGYVGNTTTNKWYKMERPGVLLEGGHVTHVSLAVSDVDKNNAIPGGSNHGSKVIVVPFDGVAFDAETGVGGGGSGGGSGGGAAGQNGGAAGRNGGAAGQSGGGAGQTAGGAGGLAVGSGGSGGLASGGGGAASGGHGGATGSSLGSIGGRMGQGGMGQGGEAGRSVPTGGSAGMSVAGGDGEGDASSGCSCATESGAPSGASGWLALLGLAVVSTRRRRRGGCSVAFLSSRRP